jgi:biopolymer transport protein TolR
MADIMLVLLIIFMITTPLLQTDISVNLPKAKNPLDVKEGPMVIALNREGRIYFGKTAVSEQEMIKAVTERLASDVGRNMFLRADQAVQYGKVVQIVNECRKLGVERIGLMTDREATSAP